MAREIIATAQRQIERDEKCRVHLLKGRKVEYRADIIEIVGGGAKGMYPSPETKKTPDYYSDSKCSVWFKLHNFAKLSGDEFRMIVLYKDPYMSPSLGSMKGIIYVSLLKRGEKIGRMYGGGSNGF